VLSHRATVGQLEAAIAQETDTLTANPIAVNKATACWRAFETPIHLAAVPFNFLCAQQSGGLLCVRPIAEESPDLSAIGMLIDLITIH
jgi:hypothetical protein